MAANELDTSLTRAIVLKHQGQRIEALEIVSQILQQQPDFADALWLRGWLHAEMGNKLAAVKDFQQLIKIQPEKKFLVEAEAALKRMGYSSSPQKHSDNVSAPKLMDNASAPKLTDKPSVTLQTTQSLHPTETHPDIPADVAQIYLGAELLYRARKYADAAEKFKQVIDIDPDYKNGEACGKLCRGLFLSNQSARAVSILEPLRNNWEQNPFTKRQMALCEYALEAAHGLPHDVIPACVAKAFCVAEAQYPIDAPEVQRVAKRIFRECNDDYSKAKAAYNYIRHNVRYDASLIPLGRQSPIFTLTTGRAVCTGFAQTYITLCRVGGIPARLVSGRCRSGFHNWTEVWLVGRGWVKADPTRARSTGVAFGCLNNDVSADLHQRENW